jgi:16S rRNA (guanine527-N7)-methyltransferase
VTEDVSRETPPAPAAAQGVFSHALPVAEAYARWLATDGVVRGLIGPREAPRLWERHLLNCAVLAEAVPPGSTVCDVGSGAGLPGIPLAIARPDLAVTLVEPLLRRSTFLEEVVRDLGLANVEVVRCRAEELHGQRSFDVVTSRAVAPLPKLLRWSVPLVRPGGLVLAMKGSSAADEVAAARPQLRKLGASAASVQEVGADVLSPATVLVRVEVGGSHRLGSATDRPSRPAGRGSRGSRRRSGRTSDPAHVDEGLPE